MQEFRRNTVFAVLVIYISLPSQLTYPSWHQSTPLCFATWPISRSLKRSGRCSLVAARQALPPKEAQLKDLFNWLEGGGAKGLDRVSARDSAESDAGTGVFAEKDFEPGEFVVSVPKALCIHGIRRLLSQGAEVATAAALLRESRLAEKSAFASYIASLPTWSDLKSHPFMWQRSDTSAMFAALHQSPGVTRRLRLAKMQAAASTQALLAAGATDCQQEARWALAVVRSRAFPLDAQSSELVLCPLLDLLNHHTQGSDRPHGAACGFLRTDEKTFGMVAERPVSRGEELCHLYVMCSSAELFANYGFAPKDGNAGFETCTVAVPAAEMCRGGSEIREARRTALLARRLWQGSSNGRPLLVQLFGNPGNSLLLPVARLATVPSAQMVQERAEELLDMRERLRETDLEIAACSRARDWLAPQIAEIEAAVVDLAEPSKAHSDADGARTAANRLLSAENSMLQQASEWISRRLERLS